MLETIDIYIICVTLFMITLLRNDGTYGNRKKYIKEIGRLKKQVNSLIYEVQDLKKRAQ